MHATLSYRFLTSLCLGFELEALLDTLLVLFPWDIGYRVPTAFLKQLPLLGHQFISLYTSNIPKKKLLGGIFFLISAFPFLVIIAPEIT